MSGESKAHHERVWTDRAHNSGRRLVNAQKSEVSSVKSEQLRDDARELGALGYAQELCPRMGAFSNFAISFSIISILNMATCNSATSFRTCARNRHHLFKCGPELSLVAGLAPAVS